MGIIRNKSFLTKEGYWLKIFKRFAEKVIGDERIRKILKTILILITFLSSIATIFATVVLMNSSATLRDFSKAKRNSKTESVAINEWKGELDCLRIGYNKNYIENEIGIPQISEGIENEDVKRCIYVNQYFSLICFYRADSLLGFLIIGNNKNFNFENYRCNFSLFDYTINETEEYCFREGLNTIVLASSNIGGRLDNNRYYFECNLQHSKGATSLCTIGYGICDIGYIEDRKLFDELLNLAKSEAGFESEDYDFYLKSKDSKVRDLPINAFMVFDGGYIDEENEFIKSYIVKPWALGMEKDEYANTGDFMNNIDSFLEDYN